MVYLKHPTLGNRHVSHDEAEKLIAEGWVKWPRTKEQKQGIVKRGPGRPPKAKE